MLKINKGTFCVINSLFYLRLYLSVIYQWNTLWGTFSITLRVETRQRRYCTYEICSMSINELSWKHEGKTYVTLNFFLFSEEIIHKFVVAPYGRKVGRWILNRDLNLWKKPIHVRMRLPRMWHYKIIYLKKKLK